MSLDKRIVLLRLDGVHQIVGLGPALASFPPALKWDTGWAKLLVVQPRYVIYQEQDTPSCVIDHPTPTLKLSPLARA